MDKIIEFRKVLHSFPELSGEEKETAGRILTFLQKCNPSSIITDVGGYGLIATWDSNIPGHEILFRSELDALPIQEVNEFSHKSKNNGVSHKCGHDGHSAILCGLAQLIPTVLMKGKIHLLFQPAEENGMGASAILNDSKFNEIKPDFVFALHNIPSFPLHSIIVKENSFSAAVNSIIIELKGKTSHAAEPEFGINPAMAVSEIIIKSLSLAINDSERDDMRVVTPVYVHLGEKAYGTSAGYASVHLTLRCWNNDNLRKLEEEIEASAAVIAKSHGLAYGFDYTQTFYANINDKSSVEILRRAANKNEFQIIERLFPFKWGEDFGLFTSGFKGAMFGLGAGENCPALHNPDYDFPEALIESGVKMFKEIIQEIQNNEV